MKQEVQEMKEFSEERKNRGKIRKRAGRIAGWGILILVCLIVVPIGFVMLVLSGIWSLADRGIE